MISEEITFLQLAEVTFVYGADLCFHLGCLKLTRLQQRRVVLWVFFVRGQCFWLSLPCSLTNTLVGKDNKFFVNFVTFILRSTRFY